jgi:hypothetical protein
MLPQCPHPKPVHSTCVSRQATRAALWPWDFSFSVLWHKPPQRPHKLT